MGERILDRQLAVSDTAESSGGGCPGSATQCLPAVCSWHTLLLGSARIQCFLLLTQPSLPPLAGTAGTAESLPRCCHSGSQGRHTQLSTSLSCRPGSKGGSEAPTGSSLGLTFPPIFLITLTWSCHPALGFSSRLSNVGQGQRLSFWEPPCFPAPDPFL